MKTIQGNPININHDIIGKITYSSRFLLNRRNMVYVSMHNALPKGFAAIVTNNSREQFVGVGSRHTPIVCGVDGIDSLNNGDIVCINPNGSVTILFKKGRNDNALLITERCNCSCIMCPQRPASDETDKTDFNLKVISLMDRTTLFLGLTGGEPTLLGDKFIEILQACKVRLPRAEINLLTNGIALTSMDFAEKVYAVKHPNLTIDIPLYADTDTEHNKIVKANSFYKIIKSLYNLAILKQRVGIRIVIIKQNSNRLKAIAEFIYRNFPFVIHIAFMQMEPVGLARENISNLWVDPNDYAQGLGDAVMYLAMRDMNVSVYNSQLCVLPKSLWKFSRKSISSWKNIYINECQGCINMNECGGFFSSSSEFHSAYIKAFKEEKEEKIA